MILTAILAVFTLGLWSALTQRYRAAGLSIAPLFWLGLVGWLSGS